MSPATSSPAKITGLKNGQSYSFTITAENINGKSEEVTTNNVKPQAGVTPTTIDKSANAKYLATGLFRTNPVIAYSDSISGNLKLATYSKKKWSTAIIDMKPGMIRMRGYPIEQLIGKLKRFKRVAMRCEKTMQNYGALVSMAFVFILIKCVHTA